MDRKPLTCEDGLTFFFWGGVQGQGSVKMFDNQLHIGKVYKINVLYNYYQNKSKIKNHKLPL